MTDILKIVNLSHRYHSSWAVKDINLEITAHGVTGFLGSNGAGKSTTMNIMCGVLNQTAGNVYINGINMRKQPELAKQQLGFLPQNAPLYLELTVDEYLNYCAALRQIPAKEIRNAVSAAKEKCGVSHFSKRLLKNLSGGYRQRVGIAQAIIHNPRLVVLDEPTNGLDPNQILEVRRLIKEIGEQRTVIFSSHILSEVQATCQDIKMIDSGEMVFSDSMEAFNNYIVPESLLVSFEAPPSETELLSLGGIQKAESLNAKNLRLYFNDPKNITERIIQVSIERGWRLQEISLEKSSLDEIFAKLSNLKNQKKS